MSNMLPLTAEDLAINRRVAERLGWGWLDCEVPSREAETRERAHMHTYGRLTGIVEPAILCIGWEV